MTWDNLYAQGELLGIPSALQATIVKQWLQFRSELGLEAVHIEAHVVNDWARCAGTVDRIDKITRPIVTGFGTLYPDDLVIGDIKTGRLTTDRNGHPKHAVKYGVQLHLYGSGDLYDTDTDTRIEWEQPPRQDIAFIYHYDLARALDGETVSWLAIPVNLHAAATGTQVAIDARNYAKRKDIFGPPIVDRRTQLRERYHTLAEVDQRRFVALAADPNDLDAVEKALDAVDPFCQVVPPQPRKRGAA